MDCRDYVARFSEYLDGVAPEEAVLEAGEHESSCAACRHYRRVVEEGAALLRTLPGVEVREDFGRRLQHRLYHVDDEIALRRHASSGTTSLTALGMAVLLAVAAWSPTLGREPTVKLDPIVVTSPPAPARPMNALPTGLLLPPLLRRDWHSGLWDDAHALLFQYSPLQRRYRQRTAVRQTELDQSP